jgi:hypothetical protein
MTTWPSASKATTTHTDSGSDKPRLAREDINQNILNVNDVIDYFNVASASDGDILVYNSSTAKMELGNSNTGFFNIKESPKETINAISGTSGSITVDAAVAPVHKMTLNDNTTFTFTNMTTGSSVSLIININASDKSATFTSDGSTLVKFSGGAPTLTGTSGQIDFVVVFFDGTNYIGSITQRIS